MTLNRISSSCFYDKMQGNKEQQTSKLSTEQAFLNRYNSKDTGDVSDPVLEETSRTNCLSTSILLHSSGKLSIQATVECSARHISYDEADHVKTFVESGYTLKAQVSVTRHKVYIEKKSEDGSVSAYEVDPLQLTSDTEDPIEQMALESWELAKRSLAGEEPFFEELDSSNSYMNKSIEEAITDFYHFIEDCIKNGDPKYQTGGSEISVKDWKRLMEYIDDTMEQVREEQRLEAKESKAQTLEHRSDITNSITAEQIARLFEDLTSSSESTSDEDSVSEPAPAVRGSRLMDRIEGKQAPYSSLANEDGVIEYNGIILQCDFDNNRLILGDCSNLDNCIRVPLSGGGEFVFNRDQLSNISKIISMFSPEDQNRIMRAISLDKQCRKQLKEIEDTVTESVENISENSDTNES